MMVQLLQTPAILRAAEYLDSRGELSDLGVGPSNESRNIGSSALPISHETVIRISQRIRELSLTLTPDENLALPKYHLDDLLTGSRVYIKPPEPKAEPTSEYKALMARLRREEEARQYDRMINPPPPAETFSQRFPGAPSAALFATRAEELDDDDEISFTDINRQMTLIANILVSVVACSVAIWVVAKHWSTPSRLGLSMGGSGLVGIAEAVVYLGYLRRLKEARQKGRKEIEIKEIIKTWVIGRDDSRTPEPVPVPANPSDKDALRQRKILSR